MSENYNQKQWNQATPIPSKFLLPDGTVVDELPTAGGGGSGGTTNYSDLMNKPKINGVTLNGNKSASDLGLASKTEVDNKVEKVTGKQLSTNDYANNDKAKVEAIPENPKYTDTIIEKTSELENDGDGTSPFVTEEGLESKAVTKVNGESGDVTVNGSNINVTKGGVTKKLDTVLSEIKEVKVSEVTGNALQEKDDGLYVPDSNIAKHEITTTNTDNIVCIANPRNDTLIKIKNNQGSISTIYFLDKIHVVFTETFNFLSRYIKTQAVEGTKIYIRSLQVFTQDDNLYFCLPAYSTFEISYIGTPMTITVGALPALKRTMYVFHEKSFIEGNCAIHWRFSRKDNECLQSISYRISTPYGESVRESDFRVVTNPEVDMDDIYFYFKNTDGQTLYIDTDNVTTVTELMDKFETLKTFNVNSPLFGKIEGDFYGQSESGASAQYFPVGLPAGSSMFLQFKCYTADPMATACWFNMSDYNSYEDYDIDIMTQQTLDR